MAVNLICSKREYVSLSWEHICKFISFKEWNKKRSHSIYMKKTKVWSQSEVLRLHNRVHYSDYRDVNKEVVAPELLPLARKWEETNDSPELHTDVHIGAIGTYAYMCIHRSCTPPLDSVWVWQIVAECRTVCNLKRRHNFHGNMEEEIWNVLISMPKLSHLHFKCASEMKWYRFCDCRLLLYLLCCEHSLSKHTVCMKCLCSVSVLCMLNGQQPAERKGICLNHTLWICATVHVKIPLISSIHALIYTNGM